jgi:hypothetical protein
MYETKLDLDLTYGEIGGVPQRAQLGLRPEPQTTTSTKYMARPSSTTNYFLDYETRENTRKSRAGAKALSRHFVSFVVSQKKKLRSEGYVFTMTLVLLCSLAQQPVKAQGTASRVAWKSMMTIAEVRRDTSGDLLSLQPYDQTIRRGMSFLLDDHLKWFKGPKETITDENGHVQMPWVYYSNVQHNGAPFPNSIDRFVSYPAFHRSLLIRTFIRYSSYSGDDRALAEAIKLADWNLAHSTPGDWAYGNLPYSTFQEKKPGGFRDKTGLMPDKAAIMALAYIDLYKATHKPRFLKAAQAIAQTLADRQRPNGTWPFRVDPKTEKVVEEYTSSVITYYLPPDKRIVVGFQYHQWWYSCHTGVVLYLLDFINEADTLAEQS